MSPMAEIRPAAALLLLAVSHPGRGVFSLITGDLAPMTAGASGISQPPSEYI